MKRFLLFILLLVAVRTVPVYSCGAEGGNPFAMSVPETQTAGRVLAKGLSEQGYVVMPIPPEILDVQDRAVSAGREFLVSARFRKQRKISALEFLDQSIQDSDRGTRKAYLFINDIADPGYRTPEIINIARYEMECFSGCGHEMSLWKVVVPQDALPAQGTELGYFVSLKDEYGNVASEVPSLVYYSSSGDELRADWESYLSNGFVTPAIDDDTYTMTDDEDSLNPKADIKGMRAAISRNHLFVEASFVELPFDYENSELINYTLNIFSSGANDGDKYDGLGQMIEVVSKPPIRGVDCTQHALSASDGNCFLNSSTSDYSVLSNQCEIEYSYNSSSDRMSYYYYETDGNIVFEFEGSLFGEATGQNFPGPDDFMTIVITVAVHNWEEIEHDLPPVMYDISPGMNLYPRTHSFVVSELSYATVTVPLAAGWNMAFKNNEWLTDAGVENAADLQTVSLSDISQNNAGSEAASGNILEGLWYYSNSDGELAYTYPAREKEGNVYVTLTEGWNVIGHHLSSDVLWRDENISVIAGENEISLDQAEQDGIIVNQLFDYDNGTYRKVGVGEKLQAGRGYLIKSKQTCTLKIGAN